MVIFVKTSVAELSTSAALISVLGPRTLAVRCNTNYKILKKYCEGTGTYSSGVEKVPYRDLLYCSNRIPVPDWLVFFGTGI